MNNVIVAVDLGHFKAYRVTRKTDESARVDLLESYDMLDTHGRLKDKFTDAEGSFPRGYGKSGMGSGSGEQHNIDTETEKKVIGKIADDINALVEREGCAKWCLAAAERINNRIVENLNPSARSRLDKNIKADLTNTDKSGILGYFEE